MNSMKTQWRGTGELKSCSVGKCRPPKEKGRLHILLFALPLRFWFHPSSLQFAGLQSGVWHCHNPQASFLALRYETRRTEKRVTPIFPSSQNCKTSQGKNPSLHPASRAPHTLPTHSAHPQDAGLSLHPPHMLPREVTLGATCDNHHFRGSTSGGQKTHQGKARDPANRPHLWVTCMFSEF